MNTTKRWRVSGKEPETMTRLPEELILEILTWVPGRELGRCKCVCKLWKSLIGSPPFLPLYRRRNRCLMLHWSEGRRLHFHYSLLRRHRTDFNEEFRRLGSLRVGRRIDPVTQLVNGVICSGEVVDDKITGREPDLQLKVISVCTGQALRIPQPSPHNGNTLSSYHLGYDPRSKRYKLLRLMFPYNRPERMEAEVITLGPTGTVWEWRKLDHDGAGISRLPLSTDSLRYMVTYNGVLTFSGDGVLCWIREGMILFDMNKEIFRWVKLPLDGEECKLRTMVPRVLIDDKSLVIYLWVLPARPSDDVEDDGYTPECECFMLEDREGNVWRKRSLKLPVGLRDEPYWLGTANGSLISASESIMLMNNYSVFTGRRRDVYCCTNEKGIRRFWVGQLPSNMRSFDHNKLSNGDAAEGFRGRLSCLLDSNVLYLSLKDVLNGNGLV